MEVTVTEAVYVLLSGTLGKGLILNRRETTRTIQEKLLSGFGVEVSRRHICRILKDGKDQGILMEHYGIDRKVPSISQPTDRVVSLARPIKIIQCRKWKRRDGAV